MNEHEWSQAWSDKMDDFNRIYIYSDDDWEEMEWEAEDLTEQAYKKWHDDDLWFDMREMIGEIRERNMTLDDFKDRFELE